MNPNDQPPPDDALAPAEPSPAQPERAEPSLAQALTQANLLRVRGRLDQAIAVCRQALERAPDSWEAHELMGDLYRQARKGDEAIAEYRRALTLNPRRGLIEEKIARASLIAAERRRLLEDAQALLAGTAGREVRKPGVAALFSFILPGLGQIYNREFVKGLALLVIWVVLVMGLNWVVLPSIQVAVKQADLSRILGAFFSGRGLALVILSTLLWIYAIADAAFRAGKTMTGPEDIV